MPMTTNEVITIWHYDEEAEKYTAQYFMAHVHHTKKRASANDKGASARSILKIRIPMTEDAGLHLGDYVFIGATAVGPARGKDWKICEIADNRRGSSPHWRVLCE